MPGGEVQLKANVGEPLNFGMLQKCCAGTPISVPKGPPFGPPNVGFLTVNLIFRVQIPVHFGGLGEFQSTLAPSHRAKIIPFFLIFDHFESFSCGRNILYHVCQCVHI